MEASETKQVLNKHHAGMNAYTHLLVKCSWSSVGDHMEASGRKQVLGKHHATMNAYTHLLVKCSCS